MSELVLEQELPKGWIIKKISELTKSYSGGTPSTSVKDYWNSNDVPWIKSGEIKDNIIKESQSFISKKGYENSSAKLYPPNTVLVAITGATTGKTAFLVNEACGTQNVFGILPCKYILPKYMWYYMQFYYTKLISKVVGTAQKHVNGSIINNTPILFPPLNEQKRIVAKIEELFSLIESSKQILEKTKILLKQYRQSLLKSAFEGKLVPQDPNDEPSSVFLERIRREKSSKLITSVDFNVNQSVLNKPTKLPKNWTLSSLGFITKNHDGKRIPVNELSRKKMRGKYPYYGASGIIDYVNKPLFKGEFLLIGEDGANLLARSTPIAFIADGEFWVNNHAHVLTTFEEIPLEFLSYFINSINLSPWVTGTAQPKLNQANMNKIPIILPPLNEQKRIITKIEESFSHVDKNEKLVDSLLQQYDFIRSSILKQAFEGKLVPQDPNDKPAEILLQKITEEKQKIINQTKRGKKNDK